MKFFLIILVTAFLFISGCISDSGAKLDAKTCVYDEEEQLTCGSDWIAANKGLEYEIKANVPTKIPPNSLIGLTDPIASEVEPIIENLDGSREINPALKEIETYLIWTEPGTIELSEETSRKAVGRGIAGGFE